MFAVELEQNITLPLVARVVVIEHVSFNQLNGTANKELKTR